MFYAASSFKKVVNDMKLWPKQTFCRVYLESFTYTGMGIINNFPHSAPADAFVIKVVDIVKNANYSTVRHVLQKSFCTEVQKDCKLLFSAISDKL